MKIAMLARNPNLYSHKRLVEAAETRGHTLDILNTLRCTVNNASHRQTVTYKGETLKGYDLSFRALVHRLPPMALRCCASLKWAACGH